MADNPIDQRWPQEQRNFRELVSIVRFVLESMEWRATSSEDKREIRTWRDRLDEIR